MLGRNEEKFKQYLNELDWTEFYSNTNSVEVLWQNFKSKFMALSDKHAPFVAVRKKRNGVPRITEEYIKLARERDFYRKKFKSTKLNADWDKFKVYRNQAK